MNYSFVLGLHQDPDYTIHVGQRLEISPGSTKYWIPEVEQEKIPCANMHFRTLEAEIQFYKDYGLCSGFDVRRSTTKKFKNEDIHMQYVVCNREGYKNSKKPIPGEVSEHEGSVPKQGARKRASNRMEPDRDEESKKIRYSGLKSSQMERWEHEGDEERRTNVVSGWKRLLAVRMMSVMSTSKIGSVESPSGRGNGAVGEEPTVASTSTGGFSGCLGLGTVGPTEEAAPVSVASGGGLEERRVSDNVNDPRVLKLENEGHILDDASGGENQPSSSVSRMHGNRKKTGSRNGKLDHKRNRSVVEDYDSILSAFDEFAAKGEGEAVGYGYKIGDMVWGKVKSHPWWPGQIYNEAFASPSVRRSSTRATCWWRFLGTAAMGENFVEKSRQTTSRTFVKAVEEAVDELSRRSSLGLACRCRNEFNFWPSNVEGYFVVNVGDYEPGVYGLSQISKSRDGFWPREMLSFVQQMASEPSNDQHWTIDFIKNKATVLAYRKALFEEFDETYAQAFGTVPVRPPRPTAPVAVNPSKGYASFEKFQNIELLHAEFCGAIYYDIHIVNSLLTDAAHSPLSGRLVIAEALGKGKISVKPAKTKEQVEKDKYLFKRREESIQMKSKKASSGQGGHTLHPLSVGGSGFSEKVMHSVKRDMHKASESGTTDGLRPPTSHHQASISRDIKPSEGSRKLVEGGTKKSKALKRPAGDLSAENAILVEKKKKKKRIGTENGIKLGQLPLALSNSAVAVENILRTPLVDSKGPDNHKDAVVDSSSSQSQQAVDFDRIELQMLVTDLRALALNPFHGEQRSCPAVIRQVFLKYRSLVYQKSLVLSPPTDNEASDVNSSRSPAATVLAGPGDKTNDKIVKHSVKRLDDPTKGGKKRGPSDRVEDVKKKKKKIGVLEELKKKKIDNSKLSVGEKKIIPRVAPTESQRGDVKENAAKNVPKVVKLESSKRMAVSPTMLVMKFPAGAALPSGSELRAKFARFGPLDHTAMRIFWKTYTCRLVYLHKVDLTNLFGNTNVRCYVRELEVEAAESEPVVKLQKEDVSVGVERRTTAPKIGAAQPQSAQQLKSCLKKPSGDEGGNGGGRVARVKFVLGGDESVKAEPLFNENKNNNTGASSMHSVDISSKILPKLNPQSSNPIASSSGQFQKSHLNTPSSSEQGLAKQMPGAPINDISQQMLNLLMRCNDVVNNLTSVLGYMPYHTL
ncbi:hypothetical protein DH2020_003270 [Rehmannia glutinosa]|uniref:PWWP domain-containing protein n=1 Tax=Rehmannia glutinosa TaxID=99300 RepID=A0ABR0XL47_REHGL